MSHVSIREYDAKKMLAHALSRYSDGRVAYDGRVALVTPHKDISACAVEHGWIMSERLAIKPDMVFGKRGKHGLILLKASFEEAKQWIQEKSNKAITVSNLSGTLTHFLIEPFIPHEAEYYVAIKGTREGDTIYFSEGGGVAIEDHWDRVIEMRIGILDDSSAQDIARKLPKGAHSELIAAFVNALFRFYVDYNFAFLEINPFTIVDDKIIPLDIVAKLDSTANFESGELWGNIEFPPSFGKNFLHEEEYIKSLDEKTGASLKLTVLNPQGRLWTLVAGGGASVIYADTISDAGYGKEMANYGEYSGNPSTEETYEYAKTVLGLMVKNPKKGKALIIGGGIANFTDVAQTFVGIIRAMREYAQKLGELDVRVYVRRGGPNYEEGLKNMKQLGKEIGVPMEVYGPELHMTEIVHKAIQNLP